MNCPKCASEISATSASCPHCGSALDPRGSLPTVSAPQKVPSPVPPVTPRPRADSSPSSAFEAAGFAPGRMFAARYRIAGLLGRGGMGEVYRADDLKLGQPVALKFLARKLAEQPELLERFYAEVRLARQVSHPNVCRVYDVGEAEDLLYLSMEYVDGEDLASLLKRIGRLPPDKALDIARELCVGLAAAHERGVIHRDLKPANVMLDGRGHARITDFGLAVPLAEGAVRPERAGTPAYMAPEQLTGGDISVQTDLYALGLILYEVFTGKRPFEAKTLPEHLRLLEIARPASVAGADPATEEAILRCLEKDPKRRPTSALAVAAGLPGGDPLAAALAAGETPSPELVAAAGEEGALRPPVALACMVAFVAGLLGMVWLEGKTSLYGRVPLESPPAVLKARAKEIIQRFGYAERPAETVTFFAPDQDYLRYVESNDKSPNRWKSLATDMPPAVHFVYRQSPRSMIPFALNGVVTYEDPPANLPGMVNVRLDTQGRLLSFRAVAPQLDAAAPLQLDWRPKFEAAGLDLNKFASTTPMTKPPAYVDVFAAWTGAYPERPDLPIRVEAAAYGGKPVYFAIVGPWTKPPSAAPPQTAAALRIGQIAFPLALFLALFASGWLARRNVRMGRGDRSGAFKLGIFAFATAMLFWVFAANHASNLPDEWTLFTRSAGPALFSAVQAWLLYLALEPYVRRRWPHTLISWNRILAGRFRNPLVGRDILIGGLFGLATLCVTRLRFAPPAWSGLLPAAPGGNALRHLDNSLDLFAVFFQMLGYSIFIALIALVVFLLLRIVLRKQWLAVVGVIVVGTLAFPLGGSNFHIAAAVVWITLHIVVLLRFGAVAMAATNFFQNLLLGSPITLDPSAWYFGQSLAALFAAVALAGYGFYTSLGKQKVFRALLLEDEA